MARCCRELVLIVCGPLTFIIIHLKNTSRAKTIQNHVEIHKNPPAPVRQDADHVIIA